MDEKIPFYMTYPMKNAFDDEWMLETDFMRMREMFPADAKKIQELVEDVCDRMEYEGSMMFDEYPDRFSIHMMCRHIQKQLEPLLQDGELVAENCNSNLMCQLIEVMLMEEMYKRRCRHHRCRRWY